MRWRQKLFLFILIVVASLAAVILSNVLVKPRATLATEAILQPGGGLGGRKESFYGRETAARQSTLDAAHTCQPRARWRSRTDIGSRQSSARVAVDDFDLPACGRQQAGAATGESLPRSVRVLKLPQRSVPETRSQQDSGVLASLASRKFCPWRAEFVSLKATTIDESNPTSTH